MSLRKTSPAEPFALGLDLASLGPYSLPGFPYVKLTALALILDIPIGEPIPSKLVFTSQEMLLGATSTTILAYDPGNDTFGYRSVIADVDPQVHFPTLHHKLAPSREIAFKALQMASCRLGNSLL